MNQKFCPNCGHMQPREAEVCSNCGHQFKKIDQGEASQSSVKQQQAAHSSHSSRFRYGYVMIGAILLVLVLIGGATAIDHYHQQSRSATTNSAKRLTTKEHLQTAPKKAAKPAAPAKPDPNESNLTTNLDPKQNAAVISYYGAKEAGWKDLIDPNVGLTIRTSTGSQLLNRLTAKGQSMTYAVFKGQNVPADAHTNFVYTIDENGNINLYNLPADSNATNIAPVKTISRDDATKYINEHQQANDVRKLSSKVNIVNANN